MTKKLHQEKARSLKILEANNFNQNPELKKRIEARNTVFANHTFDEKIGKEFIFDNEKVQLIYPGPGHSPDNLVVYFPKRKVMYGTCMIRGGDSLGYLGDADVKSWASSVRKIKALDVNIIIPGHGLTGGPELIKKTIELAEKEQTRGLSN
jgi:glyoxylase-like metal-dependent hydrolase (beta-lactamase superfamily II)